MMLEIRMECVANPLRDMFDDFVICWVRCYDGLAECFDALYECMDHSRWGYLEGVLCFCHDCQMRDVLVCQDYNPSDKAFSYIMEPPIYQYPVPTTLY